MANSQTDPNQNHPDGPTSLAADPFATPHSDAKTLLFRDLRKQVEQTETIEYNTRTAIKNNLITAAILAAFLEFLRELREFYQHRLLEIQADELKRSETAPSTERSIDLFALLRLLFKNVEDELAKLRKAEDAVYKELLSGHHELLTHVNHCLDIRDDFSNATLNLLKDPANTVPPETKITLLNEVVEQRHRGTIMNMQKHVQGKEAYADRHDQNTFLAHTVRKNAVNSELMFHRVNQASHGDLDHNLKPSQIRAQRPEPSMHLRKTGTPAPRDANQPRPPTQTFKGSTHASAPPWEQPQTFEGSGASAPPWEQPQSFAGSGASAPPYDQPFQGSAHASAPPYDQPFQGSAHASAPPDDEHTSNKMSNIPKPPGKH